MHELSIACDLVEIAQKAAQAAQAKRVEVVHLRLGVFAGVVKEALLFGYETATKGTLLEGSSLAIEDVPLTAFCPHCNQTNQLASIQCFVCSQCGNPVTDIRTGQEIDLAFMEIVEHVNPTA